jgi:type I restriction enzyme S subunit
MKTNTLDFDAQALRERILDLAMRGKLVPQDPNDEPASVLLEKIKTEKAELIKEKKIKKTKALPEITDDEKPFDIPDSWEWVRLGDVFDITSSKRVMKSEWKEEGIPFYRAREIVSIKNHQKLKDPIFISKDTYEEKLKVSGRPQVDDILLTGVGTLGIPYVVSTNKDFYFKDGNIIWLRNIKKINPDFISYYVQSPYMLKIINNGRGTTVATLTIVRAKSLLVPLPPLSEQSRIAAKIAQLFALLRKVESSTQQYAELQTLLKSKVLDLAMRGKLVKQDPNNEPASVLLEKIKAEKAELVKEKKIKKSKPLPPITDEEKPFDIPDSWEWVRISDVLDVRDGTHDTPKYVADGIPLITSKNISNGKLDFTNINFISKDDFEKINERSKVDKGDIIFAMIGTIGNPVLVDTDTNFGIKNVALLKHFTDKLNMDFILDYLLVLQVIWNSNATGAVQKFVSLRKIRKSVLPLPPFKEQKKIVRKIDQIFRMIGE